MLVGVRRRSDSLLLARSIDPHERARVRRETSRRVHVHEHSVGGHGEIACAKVSGNKPRQHRYGCAERLQPIQIEGDRTQRSRGDVDQVPPLATLRRGGPDVAPVAAAMHEDPLRPGAQVAHRHLRRIEPARLRRDGEEDGAAAGQDFRPDVVGFALRVVGPRQHLRRPAGGRHALQPRGAVVGREDDRVVGGPRRSAGNGVYAGEGDRRATGDRDFPERRAVEETDLLTIRRDE